MSSAGTNHTLQLHVVEEWTGTADLYLHQPDGSVLQLVAADATCPATTAIACAAARPACPPPTRPPEAMRGRSASHPRAPARPRRRRARTRAPNQRPPRAPRRRNCYQTSDAHSDTQLLGLRECVAGLAKAFGLTPRGVTGAAELRNCADGDRDGDVSSEEAGEMLTSCVAYEGAPPLSPTALARLRGLAGC